MIQEKSFCQSMEEHIQECKRMGRLIYETEDAIVLNVCYEYVIAKTRIDTAEKIIRWTVHLSSKTWMTKELIEFFTLTACGAAKINPYGV